MTMDMMKTADLRVFGCPQLDLLPPSASPSLSSSSVSKRKPGPRPKDPTGGEDPSFIPFNLVGKMNLLSTDCDPPTSSSSPSVSSCPLKTGFTPNGHHHHHNRSHHLPPSGSPHPHLRNSGQRPGEDPSLIPLNLVGKMNLHPADCDPTSSSSPSASSYGLKTGSTPNGHHHHHHPNRSHHLLSSGSTDEGISGKRDPTKDQKPGKDGEEPSPSEVNTVIFKGENGQSPIKRAPSSSSSSSPAHNAVLPPSKPRPHLVQPKSSSSQARSHSHHHPHLEHEYSSTSKQIPCNDPYCSCSHASLRKKKSSHHPSPQTHHHHHHHHHSIREPKEQVPIGHRHQQLNSTDHIINSMSLKRRSKTSSQGHNDRDLSPADDDLSLVDSNRKKYPNVRPRRRNRSRTQRRRSARIKSNELWVDGPLTSTSITTKRTSIRSRAESNRTRDGNRSIDREVSESGVKGQYGHNRHNMDFVDKEGRIQEWIQQHTKQIWTDILTNNSFDGSRESSSSSQKRKQQSLVSKESKESVESPTKVMPSLSLPAVDGDDFSLRAKSMDDFFKSKIFTSEDTEDELCIFSEGEGAQCLRDLILGSGGSNGDDVSEAHSEPMAEPPRTLKLEQFLKQLIALQEAESVPEKEVPIYATVHKARDNSSNSSPFRTLNRMKGPSSGPDSKGSVSGPEPFHPKGSVMSCLLPMDVMCDQFRSGCKVSPEDLMDNTKGLGTGTGPILPTSPRVNRMINLHSGQNATSNSMPPNGLLTSSPAHSNKSVSRSKHHHKTGDSQAKRNTTSTTTSGTSGTSGVSGTSGHGTNSEGESVKSSQATPSVAQSKVPSSSGYNSTINLDALDECDPPPPPLKMMSCHQDVPCSKVIATVEPLKESTIKMRKKDSIGSGVQPKRAHNPNRDSVSSTEKCSLLCCKFFK